MYDRMYARMYVWDVCMSMNVGWMGNNEARSVLVRRDILGSGACISRVRAKRKAGGGGSAEDKAGWGSGDNEERSFVLSCLVG